MDNEFVNRISKIVTYATVVLGMAVLLASGVVFRETVYKFLVNLFPALAANTPYIAGRIEAVNVKDKLVVISIGKDQGVQAGMTFYVARGSVYISKLKTRWTRDKDDVEAFMKNEVSLVKLLTAKSPAEAEVLKGLLEAEGIPVNLRGEYAADDLAISLQASGFLAVDVEVPSDRLEEARRLVEEAQSAGKELEQQSAQEDESAEEDVDIEPEVENQS